MIGIYNYTVWFTYFSLVSAVFGIGFAASDKPFLAIICLLFSGFLDMFDGRIARTKKRNLFEIRYGVQIDSLADLVAFGVLPAFIGYSVGLKNWYWLILLSLYSLSALIRLSYFNCLTEENNFSCKEFIGMPVTTSALIFPFIYIFKNYLESNFKYLYASLLFLTLFLFLLKFKIKKPNNKVIILIFILGLILLISIVILKLNKLI